MIAQEFIAWDQHVRCLCIDREEVLPMLCDPHQGRYLPDDGFIDARLRQRLVEDSLKLVRALGYDVCTVEWAVKDGVPYAIDFLNPAPDLEANSLSPQDFDWAVKHMADMTIRLAKSPRPQEMRWNRLF
jgi:hypothetical protein